jgi:hypothetical protein
MRTNHGANNQLAHKSRSNYSTHYKENSSHTSRFAPYIRYSRYLQQNPSRAYEFHLHHESDKNGHNDSVCELNVNASEPEWSSFSSRSSASLPGSEARTSTPSPSPESRWSSNRNSGPNATETNREKPTWSSSNKDNSSSSFYPIGNTAYNSYKPAVSSLSNITNSYNNASNNFNNTR